MSFRNVALVFGPTLVRGAAQDMLTSMNESYTIVEALCRHVSVCVKCVCVSVWVCVCAELVLAVVIYNYTYGMRGIYKL